MYELVTKEQISQDSDYNRIPKMMKFTETEKRKVVARIEGGENEL